VFETAFFALLKIRLCGISFGFTSNMIYTGKKRTLKKQRVIRRQLTEKPV